MYIEEIINFTQYFQLFDQESWTFTYLLGCAVKKEAILVDPVDMQVERDIKLLKELGLDLKYAGMLCNFLYRF